MRLIAASAYRLVLATLTLTTALIAQHSNGPPPAPIPSQIVSARKDFISDLGGEGFETVFDQSVFHGGPDRPYNDLYAAMKTWKKFELVSSPTDADLVFEISWALSDTGLKLPVLGQVRMVVVDPKTNIPLWTFIEYVRGAMLISNRDKNFDHALNTIIDRLKLLSGVPAALTPDAGK